LKVSRGAAHINRTSSPRRDLYNGGRSTRLPTSTLGERVRYARERGAYEEQVA
jgi:hypothetical protein